MRLRVTVVPPLSHQGGYRRDDGDDGPANRRNGCRVHNPYLPLPRELPGPLPGRFTGLPYPATFSLRDAADRRIPRLGAFPAGFAGFLALPLILRLSVSAGGGRRAPIGGARVSPAMPPCRRPRIFAGRLW